LAEGKTENTVKGNVDPYSGNSVVNGLDKAIENALASKVHTAEVVRVTGVDAGGPSAPAGYVDVAPMVNGTDNFGGSIAGANLYRLPYLRVQGGKAALVIDPEPGDIGLAVFTKSDSTNVGQGAEAAVQPASMRSFDQGNGFYVSAFLNKPPETFVELNKEGQVNIKGKADITIETAGKIILKGSAIEISGPVTADGIVGNGISLDGHTHPGDSGGTTGRPQ
jgi:hypothetical protein